MKAAIPAAYLQSLGYSAADVSLNDPSCLPEVTDELVTFDISYTQCGTVKTVDNSTITYSNSLSVLPPRNLVTRQKKLNMAVRCKMHQGTKVGIAYQLEDAVPIQKTQYGHFDLSVLFYNSSLFLASTGQPPYAFNPDQEMYVEAVLPSSDPDLQLFVDTCVASASQADFKTISYDLIRNGCIQDSTYRTLPSPSSKNARFSFGAFPFLRQNKRIFLQCEMVVCSESDPSSRCRQVHHRRRKRSLGSYLNAKDILLGPIQLVG
ncbi:deleted in malignant brain tumors 1 protein-like [Ambystoma mexicanum]|uniref:deleted in malignant brain tumors 1 protein-like n=1 Tax=Ambystoma mexicanum TaxID=8296 RepID=UPI0037E7495A